jgi:hypothetical protein
MNNHSFAYTSVAVLAALAIAITMSPTNIGEIKPSYAQSTFGTPPSLSSPDIDSPTETGTADDGENFQQFMECLFEGEASEEDISSALEGGSDSSPTEQEIRDCFAPLYNTGGTTPDTAATAGSGSTGEADDSNPEEDGGSSTDGETSDDEEESGNS